jgi:hypothetical protein
MRILLLMALLLITSMAQATDLHLRIVAGSPDIDKIPVSSLFAALRDWADDASVGANRGLIINEWSLDASAVADLDALRDQYVAIVSANNDIQQARRDNWVTVVNEVSVLAEESRFGYENRADWANRINSLTDGITPLPTRLSLTPTP